MSLTRHLLTTIVLLSAMIVGSQTAHSETVLRISSWAPPTHHINAVLFPTWARWLEQETEGRVKAEIVYRLAPPPRQFDVVRDGAADVSWIFHGYNPGQFVSTQVVELPLLGANAIAGSAAYWRTYMEHLREAMDAEHEGVKIIGLTTHGPGVIQTRVQINSWSDIEDMKFRVPGGIASQLAERLGAVKVSVPAPQVYEVLQSRVADGVFMPVETHKSFRLSEVTSEILTVPGNFYDGSFAFIMNPDSFNALSDEDQQALMRVSGERLSAFAGSLWHAADQEGLAAAREAGTNVREANDEMMAEFQQIAAAIRQDWIDRAGDKFDANAARAFLEEQARSYEAPASFDPD